MSSLSADAQIIFDEYEKTLSFPPNKPSPQFIVCPIGLIGSGKTTVVTALAEELSLLRISRDDLRRLCRKYGIGQNDLFDITKNLVEKYINEGYSLAFDFDCVSEAAQKHIASMQETRGIIPVWIHINPPESFMLENNKRRTFESTGGLFLSAEKAVAAYESRKALHAHLNFPFVYTFDPSQNNFADQINEGCAVIQKFVRQS